MKAKTAVLPPDLAAACRKIDTWRTGNSRRRRIPESMWSLAADLAGVHGAHRVGQAMRLSSDRIKKRVAAGGAQIQPAAAAGGFVELTRTPRLGTGMSDGLSVELHDSDGRSMTIRGAERATVASLVAAFCGGATS